MTNKTKQLIYLLSSILFLCVSIALIAVSTVKSMQYGKNDFSHNLKIKEVVSDTEVEANGVLHHSAILEGGITNNTKNNYILTQVQVVLVGVNNKTGEYAETVTSFVLESFDGEKVVDLTNESIKVGDRSGFIPESVGDVKITIDGNEILLPFEEVTDVYLIMFAISLACLFIGGFLASKWWLLKKPLSKKVENVNTGSNIDEFIENDNEEE